MPYTRTPTYQHSRRRAAASLARHQDVDEAFRVARVPSAVFDSWLKDPEFVKLLGRALRRAERRPGMLLLERLRQIEREIEGGSAA